jgi:hypothetical protein
MPTHNFESLLKELGQIISIPNLESTSNNNITLTLQGKNNVILEKHKQLPLFIISFDITEIPAGRYRENVLREALKFNGLNKVHAGIFAFSKKSQKLILFDMLPLEEISGEQVHTIMMALSEKVTTWKEALSRGEIPALDPASRPRSGGGIFGIRL